MATAGLPSAAAAAAGDESSSLGSKFGVWPPTERTRDAVVRRLVDTLVGGTLICKRYGAVPPPEAGPAARAIEAEAFDSVAATGAAAASVEEGIEALQLYSKEVSRRLLHFVKSRSAATKATPPPVEAPAAAEDATIDPQPAI